MAEVELRNAVAGSDLTGSGTAGASAYNAGDEPINAVDNNNATAWSTYPSGAPQWWSYDFGLGNAYDIVQITIRSQVTYYANSPTNCDVQFSDNGSSWTTAWSFTTPSWGGVETRTFTSPWCVSCADSLNSWYDRVLNYFTPTDSYDNPLGRGYRTPYITVSAPAELTGGGDVSSLVDGWNANGFYFAGVDVTGKSIKFDFGSGNLFTISEATLYQSDTSSHGVWKWQGSNNNSDWSDIGSSFTLGGATTQVQTELNGNSSLYRYYRLNGVSGTASGAPWIYEITFRISLVSTTGSSYLWKYGVGYRSSIVNLATNITYNADITTILDGYRNAATYMYAQAASGKYISFDFGIPLCIVEALWSQSTTDSHGTWKWQGSNDNSSWSDIGNSFTLGGATDQTQTELNGNVSLYSYYRLVGVSDNISNAPSIYEINFKLTVTASTRTVGDSLDSWLDEVTTYYIEGLDKFRDDSIDYWSDSAEASFPELYVEVADGGVGPSAMEATIPYWYWIEDSFSLSDEAIAGFYIWEFIIERSVADSLYFSWKDGFAVQMPPESLEVAVDDLDATSFDFIETSLLENIIPLADQAYDSNFYDIFDFVEVRLITSVWIEGQMVQTDSLAMRLGYLPSLDDALEMSDEVPAVASYLLALADALDEPTDSATIDSYQDLTLDIGDDFALSDYPYPSLNTRLTSYLRRYLNDVVRN